MKPLSILFAVSVTLSCHQPTDPIPGPAPGGLMPFNSGNFWIGTGTYYDSTGRVVMTVSDTLVIHGKEYLNPTDFQWKTNRPGLYFYTVEDYLVKRDESEGCGGYFIAKYPAERGTAFPTGCDQVYCYLQFTDIPLSVPAGKFSAYEFWIENWGSGGRPRLEAISFAPGVGPIRIERHYLPGTNGNVTDFLWTLQKYGLN